MRRNMWLLLSLLLIVTWVVPAQAQEEGEEPAAAAANYRVVGYYSSWSVYNDLLLTDQPLDLLTHLYYGPVGVSENGQCVSTDEFADTGFQYPDDLVTERRRGNFKQLGIIREQYPDLKIIMDVGGWENSVEFPNVASDAELRDRFAKSCVAYMRQFDFDGINIYWRYPVIGGLEPGRPDDAENLSLMLSALRDEIDNWADEDQADYLLTISAPGTPDLVEAFRIDLQHRFVDFVNVTTFGFQGSWSEITGHHTPLYGNPRDPRGELSIEAFNTDGALTTYLNTGVPAEKLNMGIPFYGQAWRNVPEGNLFGLFETNDGVPNGTRDGGILYYGDLETLLRDEEYLQWYDDAADAPWLYNPRRRIAISYDNMQSIRAKANYIRELGLGGVYVQEVAFDGEEDPLLRTLSGVLNGT